MCVLGVRSVHITIEKSLFFLQLDIDKLGSILRLVGLPLASYKTLFSCSKLLSATAQIKNDTVIKKEANDLNLYKNTLFNTAD